MERREYPRADLNFRVEYTEEESSLSTGGKNICPGGIAFVTKTRLAPGAYLRLVFTTDDSPHEIHARARVLRSWSEGDSAFAAAEFFEIHSEDRELLGRLVKQFIGRRQSKVTA